MHLARWILLVSILVWGLAVCFADEAAPVSVSDQNQIKNSDILAEYDGGVITRKDLEDKISKIPVNSQARYRTVEGMTQVLDIMAVEKAFMAKALQMKIQDDPDTQTRIQNASKQMLVQEYYKTNITNRVVVTDADKQKYYDDNKQAFYQFPSVSINYIQAKDEAGALQAMAEIRNGKSWAEVSELYNQNTYAKGLKSVVKNIRLNGNVPGVGNDAALEKYIAESKADTTIIYGPYQTPTGWHIFRTNEYVPGKQREFQEVLPELDQRTRPGVEARMLSDLTSRLKEKFSVVVDSTLVQKIDLEDRAKNSEIEALTVVSSTSPELNITVGNLLDIFAKLSQQEKIFYTKGQGAQQLIDQELVRSLLNADAKATNMELVLATNPEYIQMREFFILNVAFTKLVLDTIKITTDECKAYYDIHKGEYSVPANRSIEVLWFKDEKAANKALKQYTRFVKLDAQKNIAKLINDKSIKPKQATLENLYNNGVITGIGPDTAFSKMIWDNPVGYISPAFQTAKGDYAFFRTTKENPATIQSFTDTENRIYGILKQERTNTQQEKITQELFEEFHMVKYPERINLTLSAEDLFNMADNSAKQRNFKDAITFYDQIIKNYSNGTDDYRAAFMKAFTVSEDLKDTEQALQLFKDFLKKYPSGDLNESAQFMIDTLEGKNPLELEE